MPAAVRRVILTVDPEQDPRLADELSRRYACDYTIRNEVSSEAARACMHGLVQDGSSLALLIVDRSVSDCEELFAHASELHPTTRRLLLIRFGEWGDETVAATIRAAMAQGRIDYYALRPWTSPDELFHRTVTELLHEVARADGGQPRELTVVGVSGSARAYEVRNQLARNGIPHAFVDADGAEGIRVLDRAGYPGARVPVVLLLDGRSLLDPDDAALAEAYGVPVVADGVAGSCDVAVIGAGPAGLSAAVYAASEGLRVLVIEQEAIGGQAGSSSKIRNYLGFARGLTGAELAQRAYQQAWVFGASFVMTRGVQQLERIGEDFSLTLSDGHRVLARTVVLATGVSYRRLGIESLERFEGAGLYHGASPAEAAYMTGKRVFVVGAGNSAGQAALHLARYAKQVSLLVRGDSLEASMSSYLIEEIGARGNVEVRLRTQIVDGSGEDRLERLVLRDGAGIEREEPADAAFVLIGAIANTAWLPDSVARDRFGFVVTDDRSDGRMPLLFETSLPGCFAVGDVRSGSIKRVASAVGEGSVVISQIHRCLAERNAAADVQATTT